MCFCVSVCYISAVTHGDQKAIESPGAGTQGVVGHLRWVLGSNSGPLGERQML